jgi:hypothetical protein
VEVAHRRAIFKNGRTSDYVFIARGYTTIMGRKRTTMYVTVPAFLAPDVARILAPGGADLVTPQQRLSELEA